MIKVSKKYFKSAIKIFSVFIFIVVFGFSNFSLRDFQINKAQAAITYQTPGALAYSATGGTSVTPAYPASIAAGDLLVLIIGMKPSAANGGSVTTPTGWTPITSLTGAGGYGTTLGADTGNTNVFTFYKVAAGTESGTLSITLATNNVSWAQMYRFSGTGTWDVAGTTGSDTAAGNVSIAHSANPGVTAGDYILGAMVIPTDVTTPAQFSAEALSQTGITFGTVTEISEPDRSTGNDMGGVTYRAPVSSGAASAAPTFTATAGGTTTNVRGPGVFIRIREVPPDFSLTSTDIAFDVPTPTEGDNVIVTATIHNNGASYTAAIGTTNYAAQSNGAAVATADSTQGAPTYTIAKANDGNITTGWASSFVTGWVQVDMQTARDIKKVAWDGSMWSSANQPGNFTVSLSTDGINWTAVASETGYAQGTYTKTLGYVVNARYIKMDVTARVAGNAATLGELQAYSGTSSIAVDFYDGDPAGSGLLIGATQFIDSISSAATAQAQVTWIAVAGSHDIYAKIDGAAALAESNETNNQALKNIVVNALTPPDFSVAPADVVFSNNTPNLDNDLTVTATVHNNGATNWTNNTSTQDQYYDSTSVPAASSDMHYGIYASQWIAQSFTPATTISVSKVSLYMLCSTANWGSNCGELTVKLQTDNAGSPSGTTLATTVLPNGSATQVDSWVDINFPEYPTLTGGTKYWIVTEGVRTSSPDLPYGWVADNTSATYTGGNVAYNTGSGTAWTALSTADVWFRVYGGSKAPILVKFFDGDPDVSGTQIGTTQAIASLASSATSDVQVPWDAGAAGAHTIYVQVDRDAKITETNETNNKTSKAITVASVTLAAPTTPYVGYPSAQAGSTNPTGVTASTPMFSAINNHAEAVTTAQIQLTLSTDTGYASPIWNSGDLTGMTSTANGIRTPDIPYGIGTAPAGILQGDQNYIWRIRTKDAFYSDWSASGTIGMAALGSSLTARFYESKDTHYGTIYTKGGAPDRDTMSYGGWGDTYYDYLQWANIDTLGPSAADTTAANLYLNGNSQQPSNPNIYVKILTQSWDADNLHCTTGCSTYTPSDAPTSTTTNQVLMINPPTGYFATNITNIYKAWKDATFTNYGIILNPTTTTGQAAAAFAASESAWYGSDPYLEVTGAFTPPPVITVGTAGAQAATMAIPSTGNYAGGAFSFTRGSGTANVTQIIVTETGTVNANTNLSNLKLFYKTEATCSTSIPVDAVAFNSTGVGFNASEKATATGTMAVGTSQICLYAQLDVGSGATTNQTLEIEVSNPSTDVTASAGTVTPATAVAIAGSTILGSSAPAPTVTSVMGENPQTTAGGKSITINGTDFVATPTVTVDGTPATGVTWINAMQLTATAPTKAAGSYNVVATNPDLQASAPCVNCMTYVAPPAVTTVSPNTNLNPAGGEIITISGSGIKIGANGVKVDTTLATTSGTSIEATFTTPIHSAGSVTLRVYGASGTDTNGIYYDYSPFTYGLPVTGTLTSIVFDTGVTSPAYNSIIWKGDLPAGKVSFRIAASTVTTGPWTDGDFIGRDATSGSCGSAFWYEPSGPSVPVSLGCFANFNNKRYFKYKVKLCSSSDCSTVGTQTPTITDVIVNWSP